MPNPNGRSWCPRRHAVELFIAFITLGIFIASVFSYYWAEDGTIDVKWRETSLFVIMLSLSTSGIFFVFAIFDRTPALLRNDDEPSFLGCGKVWACLKKCFRCSKRNEPGNRNNEPPTDTTEELPTSTDFTESSTTDTALTQPKEVKMAAPTHPKEVEMAAPTHPKEVEMAALSREQKASPVFKKESIEEKSADEQDTKM